MDPVMLGIVLSLGFVVFFALMWVGIVWLIAKLGWGQIAERFGTNRNVPRDGQHFSWQSLRIGRMVGSRNYSSCINACVASEGLYLRPMIFFRMFHQQLLIPWAKVDSIEERNELMFKTARLNLRSELPWVTIYGKLGRAVIEEWEKRTKR